MSEEWSYVKTIKRTKKPYFSKEASYKLQQDLNIPGLAYILNGNESIQLQLSGYEVFGVNVTPELMKGYPEENFKIITMKNKWNDKIYFLKTLEQIDRVNNSQINNASSPPFKPRKLNQSPAKKETNTTDPVPTFARFGALEEEELE